MGIQALRKSKLHPSFMPSNPITESFLVLFEALFHPKHPQTYFSPTPLIPFPTKVLHYGTTLATTYLITQHLYLRDFAPEKNTYSLDKSTHPV